MGETQGDKDRMSPTQSKVARLITKYELEGVGEALENRWLGTGVDEQSLRDLAEWFNIQLLIATLSELDNRLYYGETEDIYRLLTDDEIRNSERLKVQRDLERDGIDVEELKSDFITHNAIYSYLTRVRGVQKQNNSNPLENTRERLQRLRSRTSTVSAEQITALRDSGRLETPEIDVVATVRVTCRSCNTYYDVDEFLERGGCDCETDTP